MVQTDNEPVFSGDGSKWSDSCDKLKPNGQSGEPPRSTVHRLSDPYTPNENHYVERQNGIWENIGAMLAWADVRLWDFAVVQLAWCFAILERKRNVVSLYEQRFKVSPKREQERLRVFGCLCFAKIKDPAKLNTFGEKWEVGVHLGVCRRSPSSWKVGVYRRDRKYTSTGGWRFDVTRNSTVFFVE